ncbi:glycosyl transferase [Klebsiella aerogenes]
MENVTIKENKKTQTMIRIVLILIGLTAIFAGLSLLSGDMWRIIPDADPEKTTTGTLVRLIIYSPSKFFFALLYVFIAPLIWLLLIRKINIRRLHHPVIPAILFLCAGVFVFLHPGVTPGKDLSIQYSRHDSYHTAIFWRKRMIRIHQNNTVKYETVIETKDSSWDFRKYNIKSAWRCKVEQYSSFSTLGSNETWFPGSDPQLLATNCSQIKDIEGISEETLYSAHRIATQNDPSAVQKKER